MDGFIHMTAWTSHRDSGTSTPQRGYGHFRSLSTFSGSPSSSRSKSPAHLRSPSSSQLPSMSTASDSGNGSLDVSVFPRRMPSHQSLQAEDQEFSTHLGPRSRAASTATGVAASSINDDAAPAHHPDLDDEVAALSTKLVNALNHQTTLDDTLSSTRQELDASKDKIRELEELVARQRETLAGDVWVKRSSVEAEKSKLHARLIDEKKLRDDVERDKRRIEQELENLTQALFEEANKMVISAKEEAQKEHDILQRKNDSLKAQLSDTQSLLKSSQEQLTELKLVMEQMTVERDDHSGTTPSSPGFSKFDSRDDEGRNSESSAHSAIIEPPSPTFPTNLTHLLQPVVRTDLASYDDFISLANTCKMAPSRASSGSYSGLNLLLHSAGSGSAPSNTSTTSLSTAATAATASSSPQTPNTPASGVSANSNLASTPLPPLKESKFYKRVLAEDVEPTLRLDTAPGLSWLARRSVLSAMTDGTLVVEPVPTNGPFAAISKPQFYPCTLCGESRRDESHLRHHRFRTSEADSAQRYPLCKYCLGRVRSTCGLLGFLRMIKDGHWRADDAEAERAAWEECVRLREQMFWSRIGGGVVPAVHSPVAPTGLDDKSPRSSQDSHVRPNPTGTEDNKPGVLARDPSEVTLKPPGDDGMEAPETSEPVRPVTPVTPMTPVTPIMAEHSETKHVPTSPAESSGPIPSLEVPEDAEKDAVTHLSLAIPGAFDA